MGTFWGLNSSREGDAQWIWHVKLGSKKNQGGEALKERQLTQGWTVLYSMALDCLLEGDKVALTVLITLRSGLRVCIEGGLGVSLRLQRG